MSMPGDMVRCLLKAIFSVPPLKCSGIFDKGGDYKVRGWALKVDFFSAREREELVYLK
jgi:hypothetical protein